MTPGKLSVKLQAVSEESSAKHPRERDEATLLFWERKVYTSYFQVTAIIFVAAGHRKRKFKLNTYKIHALGDYVATIKAFGTTDSFSTAIVSKRHFQLR
jgi:hypothetical protein